MQARHVVVGAGPVGRATARELVAAGGTVLLVSRSGAGEDIAGATRVAADAADAEALTRLIEGAEVVYNCVNPPAYDQWAAQWPPIAAALLAAAERTGAVLATTGNLYPYGPVDGPMVEGLPDVAPGPKARIRAQMSADALAAHQAGRIRTVEVRGSDYVGEGVGDNGHISRLVPRALAGKSVRVFGSADQPHSWTDVLDVARALVALAAEPRSWGRIWHAPTNPARTQREVFDDICAVAGEPRVLVRTYPGWLLPVAGRVSPLLRELQETVYQFQRPYVLDSSAITRELGLEPTPWEQVCVRTAGLARTTAA